jgi:hypothetical protein
MALDRDRETIGGMKRTARKPTVKARFKAAFELAKRFPGVERSTSYGTPAIKVKGKLMARLRSDAEGWLAIRCEFLLRDILLNAQPKVFHLTDHYRDHPFVLVDLTKVTKAALRDVLEQGWRMSASKKLLREYDEHIRG